MKKRFFCYSLAAVILASFVSCTVYHAPLEKIYSPIREKDRNPVIVMHGIKGSTLKNPVEKYPVWGNIRGLFPNAFDDLELEIATKNETQNAVASKMLQDDFAGGSFHSFAIQNDLLPYDILADFHLIGNSDLKVELYKPLISSLVNIGGFKKANVTLSYDKRGILKETVIGTIPQDAGKRDLFVFYYDWRRDNVLNAINLALFIDDLRNNYYRGSEVQFNVIAHSMGGLISRFYIAYTPFCQKAAEEIRAKRTGKEELSDAAAEQLAVYQSIKDLAPASVGPAYIGKAILLAPPNNGSMDILEALLTGKNTEALGKPAEILQILRTMPAAAQLLPAKMLSDTLIVVATTASSKEQYENEMKEQDRLAREKNVAALYYPGAWDTLQRYILPPGQDVDAIPSEQEKRRDAIRRDFFNLSLLRAAEFTAALKRSQLPTAPSVILIGGDCEETLAKGIIQGGLQRDRLMFDQERIKEVAENEFGHSFIPGDGRVTRESLLAIANPGRSLFVCQGHTGLVQDNTVMNNILYELLDVGKKP